MEFKGILIFIFILLLVSLAGNIYMYVTYTLKIEAYQNTISELKAYIEEADSSITSDEVLKSIINSIGL